MRPPTEDDAEAIAALFARCAAVDGEGAMDADEIRVWMTSPNLDPARDMRVLERAEAIVAYVDVNGSSDGTRVFLDGRVDPAWRDDPEVARTLVDYAEGRAGELPTTTDARIRAHDVMGGAAWTALLLERGYRDVRRTFEMVIELGDEPPPGPTPPAGVALRTARDGEEAAVHATVKEAFADLWDFQPESDELFVHHMGGDRSLWFLAVAGDGIPGAAVCKLDAATRIGWVDMLAVRRPWRRRGIAVALLLWAFREFHARGVREVRLRVDGDSTTGALQLYERAGMRVVSSSLLLDRAL